MLILEGKSKSILTLTFFLLSLILSISSGSSGFYNPLFSPSGEFLEEIWKLRLTRTLGALSSGAFLAGSGATLQLTLRNPLSDPFLLGISSGAALGFCLWNLFSLPLRLMWLGGFLVAFLCSLTVIFLGGKGGRILPQNVILGGVAVNAFCGAFILFLITAFMPEKFSSTLLFLSGHLSGTNLEGAIFSLCGGVLCTAVLLLLARAIDALYVGEDFSLSVGINPSRVIFLTLLFTSLSSSLCVGVSGIIGFIGLLIPHIVRLMGARQARELIIHSTILGAGFLMLTDTISRTLFPIEIPAGIITSITGAPFLAYLMWRKENARL